MAYRCREEIVGKRFLSISSRFTKLKGKARDWSWRAGFIRAATHREHSNLDLQMLVEYDDVEWQRREWISIYRDNLFHLFLVEQVLVWAERKDPYDHGTVLWPALTFIPLISKVEIPNNLQPVEFLLDRELAFKDYKNLKPFQDWDTSLTGVRDYPALRLETKRWTESQNGQKILLTTPSVLVGFRVEVYRSEGTTQWYTAVIIGYNEATRDLTVTDDTVLEVHNEDPALVQMRLIGEGVVDSIMRGENVGITPRRSRSEQNRRLLQNRVIRRLTYPSNVNNHNSNKRSRQGRTTTSETGNSSPESPNKGIPIKTRKRKASETDQQPSTKSRYTTSIKEDLENNQSHKKNLNRSINKKKVLEEANNSKLREVEVIIEDCLQTGNLLLSTAESLKEEQKQVENSDSDGSGRSGAGVINFSNKNDENKDNLIEKRDLDLPSVCNNNNNNNNLNKTNCDNLVKNEVLRPESVQINNNNNSNRRNSEINVQSIDLLNSAKHDAQCDISNANQSISNSEIIQRPQIVEEHSSGSGGGASGSRNNNNHNYGDNECVIVANHQVTDLRHKQGKTAYINIDHQRIIHTPIKSDTDYSLRGDDDGPLCSSSPLCNKMDFSETTSSLRFADDRSDSGVSSLRSGSGDERSGSRSSALSSSDEPNSSTGQQSTCAPSLHAANPSPLYVPAGASVAEPVRIWRDPGILQQEEPQVRHVHSVQHQSLLMSHPQQPSTGPQPPTSAPASHPTALYPPMPHMPPHPLVSHPGLSSVGGHPHLAPHPSLYHPPYSDALLWKHQMYNPSQVTSHILASQQISRSTDSQQLEREKALQDRHIERVIRHQEMEKLEKQKQEKDRLDRERLERDKLEKEREKQEREREEKERQEQALQNHFEKSLKAAQQKREQWNLIAGSRVSQSRTPGLSEDERKQQQEMQREQQRHLSVAPVRTSDRSYYSTVQTKVNVPAKVVDYPPPAAHSRITPSKGSEKISNMHPQMIPKELSMYGYQVHAAQNAHYEPKKQDMHSLHKTPSGLVVTRAPLDGRDMPNPLISEMKNSVIVKHDPKTPHQVEPRVSIALSPTPKIRNELMSHYMAASTGQKSNIYDYRNATQSPHHFSHAPSPHHNLESAKSAVSHHRVTPAHVSSPHHQRQSPHLLNQQHAASELRYRQEQAMPGQPVYPNSGKNSYPFLSTTSAPFSIANAPSLSSSKSKISSPVPHHLYGKPNTVSVVPVSRIHDSATPIPKPPLGTTLSPSPYQQVSQYHPPILASVPTASTPLPSTPLASTSNLVPPPAHSGKATTTLDRDRYDRIFSPGPIPPGSLSVKILNQSGTSPPTAASAPLNTPRSHPNYCISPGSTATPHQVQTQPLDLGISSNKGSDLRTSPKRKSSAVIGAPVCLELKKRRVDAPPPGLSSTLHQQNLKTFGNTTLNQCQPQLARVSEPSPLIASAATTITTLVNTAAYRAPVTAVANPLIATQSPTLLTENLPDLSVTAVNIEAARPPSTGSTHSNTPVKCMTPNISQSPSPAPFPRNTSTPNNLQTATNTVATTGKSSADDADVLRSSTPAIGSTNANTQSPATITIESEENLTPPVKSTASSITPSIVDSEKSNSPGPQKCSSASYPVRHLKKAWLQRHTGEDLEDTTGMIGSGSCVSLPLNIRSPSPAPVKNEHPVNSLHVIGSMAVNSINKSKHFQSKTINRKPRENANGHPSDSGKNGDDSSSSDQERGGRKTPPKRKPPKVKRKKGGALAKKNAEERKTKGSKLVPTPSESCSDSDKESDSAKDSDSGGSTTVSGGGSGKKMGKEPRKRGRRPKGSKNDKGEEPRAKRPKDEPPRDPFRKPPVGQLKKTGESFLQDGACSEVPSKLGKCRECRMSAQQRNKNMPTNIFCRFYAFRRLKYTKTGQVISAGFSDPHKNALEDDIKLWLPNLDSPPTDLDVENSRFLLTQVGDHFCDLLLQEKKAHDEHMSEDKTIAWKRVVQGVREMCDVCNTTLFNYHWTCSKCGFAVCLDCYKTRKDGKTKIYNDPDKERDECKWLLCNNKLIHEQDKLMLTQIIADDCLTKLGRMVHEIRDMWGIQQYCECPQSKEVKSDEECKEAVRSFLAELANGNKDEIKGDVKSSLNGIKEEKPSSLTWLADVALSKSDELKDVKEEENSEEEGNFSTLRELLIRPSHKANGSSRAASPVSKNEKKKSSKSPEYDMSNLDAIIKKEKKEEQMELKHYVRRYNWHHKGRQPLPIRIMTCTESKLLYPNVPHGWLCDGKLLRLNEPTNIGNTRIFQDQWKRGQPVIVSDVCKVIDKDLWKPEAFSRDFGDSTNDLINCLTGNLVPNQPMRKFWDGFEEPSKRLKDERGQPMLLKLKDWPPGEDFSEMLPARFQDLMDALPMPEYTKRSGKLNLASRLPECFVRPDLGPKMYNAYGSASHANKGTTNLHLDISDAVNVMVYVGIPKDGDSDDHIKEAFRAIDEAGCDILTRRRVRDKGELPGALWHIYAARDADKIRDLLNKVTVERGGNLEPNNDPIHDQSGYLDGPLRERLYKEYGVEGYAVVQCLGDAVFIPAGAPHQVRNLHNCIKVAEDFVSPENVAHCFHLMQEFRRLSDTHTNHEDKLQIKNIIYHAVKDAISTLGSVVNKRLGRKAINVHSPQIVADGDSV